MHDINGIQVNVMNCTAMDHTEAAKEVHEIAIGARLQAWFNRTFVYSSRLDLEAMPDRMKRDLGFMDGRDPPYEGR